MSESPVDGRAKPGLIRRMLARVTGLVPRRNGNGHQLRDTIEEIIDEIDEEGDETTTTIGSDERVMLTNILTLRRLTTYDVMVPRADIIAVDINTGFDRLIEVMGAAGHSRLPVYRDTLDDVVGMVHIKDVLAVGQDKANFTLLDIARSLPVVAPSMRVLELLIEMRIKRTHMALVVDEFGGIDGLVTIEDLVEEIVGEIEDEHDVDTSPKMAWLSDGSLVADARVTIEAFEELVGSVLSEEERDEDIDTLGGLVFHLADRVPARGELIEHAASGMVFEVAQADPRRIKRLRVRNPPKGTAPEAPPETAET
jgi:CBS domain containing-hemolysin-like protein